MSCTSDTSQAENCAPTCDTSTCDTSTCDTSTCGTSTCGISTCGTSTCGTSTCGTSTCGTSTCGISTCDTSNCGTSNCDISNCDISNCDISNCDTSNCNTSNCDTSNCICENCTCENCTCGTSTNEVSEKRQFGFICETSLGYTSEEPRDIITKTISDTFASIKNICNETGCTFEDTLEKLLNDQYAVSLRRDIEIVQFVEESLKTCTLPQAIQSAKEKFSLLDGHKMILPLRITF